MVYGLVDLLSFNWREVALPCPNMCHESVNICDLFPALEGVIGATMALPCVKHLDQGHFPPN